MTKQEIRLKCLELCYRKDLAPEHSVTVAEELSKFVIGTDEDNAKQTPEQFGVNKKPITPNKGAARL